MTVQTAAGAKLYIGPANEVANDSTAYAALAYSEVGEVEDLGEFGDVFNEIVFTALGDRRVRKFKGSKNAGTVGLVVGRDPSDTGQADLVTAHAADDNYAFKITLDDEGSGSPSNPTTYYFRALVMSYTANIGQVENVVRSSVSLAINSDIVEVAAV